MYVCLSVGLCKHMWVATKTKRGVKSPGTVVLGSSKLRSSARTVPAPHYQAISLQAGV